MPIMDGYTATARLRDDPEFNKHIRAPRPLIPAWITEPVFGPTEPEVRPDPGPRRVMDDTISAVLGSLTISNQQLSRVFHITVQTRDPEKSALIADTLAELYIADQVDVKLQANTRATTWLAEQVSQLEVELKESENAVKDFTAGSDVISAEAVEVRSRQLKDFRDRRADVGAEAAVLDARLAALDTARAAGPEAMVRTAGDAALEAAFARLGDAGGQAAFDARFEAIAGQVRLQRTRLAEQGTALDRSIAELQDEVARQSGELLELQQLERVASANRLMYEYFLGRLKETSLQQGIQQADSRLLSPAILPDRPSSPKKAISIVLALFVGLLAGITAVMIREIRNATYRLPEDLEAQTGLRVVGEIARGRTVRRRRVLEHIAANTNSALGEAVRNLRTSVMMSGPGDPPQLIMLTSSVPGEGKTTLSLALAHSLGSMNKRVLLVEGDIRRRTFRQYFPQDHAPGLASAVAGETPLEDAVLKSEELGIDVLMGEVTTVNAADFFTSEAFEDFLEAARKAYDFIVIDTPPVLAVPDARVIGPLADVVLYVVHWDRTTQRQVRQGLHAFATVNVPVTGLILNQIDARRQRAYGYGDGYGAYAKGYYTK